MLLTSSTPYVPYPVLRLSYQAPVAYHSKDGVEDNTCRLSSYMVATVTKQVETMGEGFEMVGIAEDTN